MISDRQLALIAPNCSRERRRTVLPHLNETLRRFEINTVTRVASFLANVLVESGEFRYTKEIWGDTPAQLRYDVGRKAIDLGNTPEADGDGKKHMGYGWIQTTGKANQTKVMKFFGLDPAHPEVLGDYPYCALSAGYFWKDKKLNKLADLLEGDWDASEEKILRSIVRTVNGGQMHITERIAYYRRSLFVLRSVPGFDPKPAAPAPAVSRPATPVAEVEPAAEPAVEPNPVAATAPAVNVGAPTVAPAGTVCTRPIESRVQQTKIVDLAAQQVTPTAAKTFGLSLKQRAVGPLARLGAWLMALLQAGNVGAWLVVIVAVAAIVYFIHKYRRTIKHHGIVFYQKVEAQFTA